MSTLFDKLIEPLLKEPLFSHILLKLVGVSPDS